LVDGQRIFALIQLNDTELTLNTVTASKLVEKKVFPQSLPINYKFKCQSMDDIVKMPFFCLRNLISVKH